MTAQRVAALRRLAKVWGASGATATAEAPVAAALINEALDAVESFWREVERGRKVEAAARALLAQIESRGGDPFLYCYECEYAALALVTVDEASLCEHHAPAAVAALPPLLRADLCTDLSYAPTVRVLRSALRGEAL